MARETAAQHMEPHEAEQVLNALAELVPPEARYSRAEAQAAIVSATRGDSTDDDEEEEAGESADEDEEMEEAPIG